MTFATLHLPTLAALAYLAGTRPEIAGVHVEISPRLAVYVSTDGAALCARRVHVPPGEPPHDWTGELTIPAAICRALPLAPPWGTLSPDGEAFALLAPGPIAFVPVAGAFPPWEALKPFDGDEPSPGREALDRIAAALGTGPPKIVGAGVAPVTFGTDPDTFGLIALPPPGKKEPSIMGWRGRQRGKHRKRNAFTGLMP